MENLSEKIAKKTRKNLMPILVLGISSLAINGCERILQGRIVKESFYPSIGHGLPDRYAAMIRLPDGKRVVAHHYKEDAREKDLRYDAGDSVFVREINNLFNYQYLIDD